MTKQILDATSSYRTASRSTRRGPVATPMTMLGLLLAAVLALSACGSAGASNANPESDDAAASESDDAAADGQNSEADPTLDFYQCLRDNGLDVQDPTQEDAMTLPEQVDTEDPGVQAIVEECSEETGGSGRITDGGQMGGNMADTEGLIAYVDCMREHGIDMPDPDPDGRLSMPEDADRNSSEFQDAAQECAEHLDGGGIMVDGGEGGGGVINRDN